MSDLLTEWYDLARQQCGGVDPRDQFFVIETADPRVPHARRIASGGVADGRPEKRGALLVTVTDDGYVSTLGVSSIEEARTIMAVLRCAWPALDEPGASP